MLHIFFLCNIKGKNSFKINFNRWLLLTVTVWCQAVFQTTQAT